MIIDADAIVHELQQPGAPLLDQLAERFGREIITADGALDRAKLAGLVFGDDASRQRPQRHRPSGGAREIARRVAANAGTDNVVVLDIPLITERDTYAMAALVVVDVPTEVAVAAGRRRAGDAPRTRCGRGWRRSSPGSERLAMADRVIDNSGDREALERQVDDVWAWIHTLPPQPT